MAELVEIINPANGRKGKVAATSKAASLYRQPPSARQDEAPPPPDPELPANLGPEKPAKNAATDVWRAYASDPRTPGALSPDEAAEKSRDELANHFYQED